MLWRILLFQALYPKPGSIPPPYGVSRVALQTRMNPSWDPAQDRVTRDALDILKQELLEGPPVAVGVWWLSLAWHRSAKRGGLIIRIGLGVIIVYYHYNKEPPK